MACTLPASVCVRHLPLHCTALHCSAACRYNLTTASTRSDVSVSAAGDSGATAPSVETLALQAAMLAFDGINENQAALRTCACVRVRVVCVRISALLPACTPLACLHTSTLYVITDSSTLYVLTDTGSLKHVHWTRVQWAMLYVSVILGLHRTSMRDA